MAYTIGCQGCRKRYRVNPIALGRTLPCPLCRLPIAVPDPRLFGARWTQSAQELPIAEPIEADAALGDVPMATEVKAGGSLKPPPLPARTQHEPDGLSPDAGLLELLDGDALIGTLLLAPRLGAVGRRLDWLEWTLRRELDFFPEGQGLVRFCASNKLASCVGAAALALGLFELINAVSWRGPVVAAVGLGLAYRGSRWEYAMARRLRLAMWAFLIVATGYLGYRHTEWEQWWRDASTAGQRYFAGSAGPPTPFDYQAIVPAAPTPTQTKLAAPLGIRSFEARLTPPPEQPKRADRLWVYLPASAPPDRSLTCVLVPASGAQPGLGANLSAAHRAEYLAYARAGLAVVAFEVDGAAPDKAVVTPDETATAFAEFKDSLAGLSNARDALEYATTRLPQVDAGRIVVAGHGTAGSLALLFAAHEPRLKACIVYAAPTSLIASAAGDRQRPFGVPEGVDRFLRDASPENSLALVRTPVFIFHALDDAVVPARSSDQLRQSLLSLGYRPRLVTIPQGGHYEATISRGIYEAIVWLRSQNLAPSSADGVALTGNSALLAEPSADAAGSASGTADGVPMAVRATPSDAADAPPAPKSRSATAANDDGEVQATADRLTTLPPAVLDLERRADREFLRARDARAGFRWLSAAAIASDDARLWRHYGWNSALGKALPGIRWGVGAIPARSTAAGRPAPAIRDADGPSGTWPANQTARAASLFRLLDEIGPVGAATVQALQTALESGRFGEKAWVGAHPVGNLRGVALIGAGELEPLLAEARGLELDVVVIFELMPGSAQPGGASESTDPSVALHVVEVLSRDELWTSEVIRRSVVMGARTAADSPISRFSDAFADFLAGRCTLEPLAAAEAGAVRRRVAALVAEPWPTPLAPIVELTLYRRRDLISAAEYASAITTLLGADDAAILLGEDQSRKLEWVQRSLPSP